MLHQPNLAVVHLTSGELLCGRLTPCTRLFPLMGQWLSADESTARIRRVALCQDRLRLANNTPATL